MKVSKISFKLISPDNKKDKSSDIPALSRTLENRAFQNARGTTDPSYRV